MWKYLVYSAIMWRVCGNTAPWASFKVLLFFDCLRSLKGILAYTLNLRVGAWFPEVSDLH